MIMLVDYSVLRWSCVCCVFQSRTSVVVCQGGADNIITQGVEIIYVRGFHELIGPCIRVKYIGGWVRGCC